jgi:hypothetical protein
VRAPDVKRSRWHFLSPWSQVAAGIRFYRFSRARSESGSVFFKLEVSMARSTSHPHGRYLSLLLLAGTILVTTTNLTQAGVVSHSSTIKNWSRADQSTFTLGSVSFKYLGRVGASNNWLRQAGDNVGVQMSYDTGTANSVRDDIYQFSLKGPVYGNANWTSKYLLYEITINDPKLKFRDLTMGLQGKLIANSSIQATNKITTEFVSPLSSRASNSNLLVGTLTDSRAYGTTSSNSHTTLNLRNYAGNSIFVQLELNVLSPFSMTGQSASLTGTNLIVGLSEVVPEPGSGLLMSGLLGLGVFYLRRKSRAAKVHS